MAKRIIYCQEILLRYKRTKALYRCNRNLTTPFLLFALSVNNPRELVAHQLP